jgi:hypothetical protein
MDLDNIYFTFVWYLVVGVEEHKQVLLALLDGALIFLHFGPNRQRVLAAPSAPAWMLPATCVAVWPPHVFVFDMLPLDQDGGFHGRGVNLRLLVPPPFQQRRLLRHTPHGAQLPSDLCRREVLVEALRFFCDFVQLLHGLVEGALHAEA